MIISVLHGMLVKTQDLENANREDEGAAEFRRCGQSLDLLMWYDNI